MICNYDVECILTTLMICNYNAECILTTLNDLYYINDF